MEESLLKTSCLSVFKCTQVRNNHLIKTASHWSENRFHLGCFLIFFEDSSCYKNSIKLPTYWKYCHLFLKGKERRTPSYLHWGERVSSPACHTSHRVSLRKPLGGSHIESVPVLTPPPPPHGRAGDSGRHPRSLTQTWTNTRAHARRAGTRVFEWKDAANARACRPDQKHTHGQQTSTNC